MHVGALHLLAQPPGDARAYVAAVRRHLAGRLHLSPVFTRRLAPMPFALANPVWVHADAVDLRAHVRHVRLPAPGSFAQLEATVARLHARLLERDRPFWRLYVIEGLASGELALYTKVHHATLDGAASVAFAHALLDTTPVPRAVPASPARGARRAPGTRGSCWVPPSGPPPRRRRGRSGDCPSSPGVLAALAARAGDSGRVAGERGTRSGSPRGPRSTSRSAAPGRSRRCRSRCRPSPASPTATG